MHARDPEYLLNEAALYLSEVEEYVWDGRSLPVPIEAIASEHFGLLVREVAEIGIELPELDPGDGQKISGALIPERAEIWVDATEASRLPRRRRYTIAHELGHWVLHRGPEKALCRAAAVEPAETVTSAQGASPRSWPWKASPGEPQIEWEANVFGGALLLPPHLVRRVWNEQRSVEAIADAFDVSLSAVEGRWQKHYDFVGG